MESTRVKKSSSNRDSINSSNITMHGNICSMCANVAKTFKFCTNIRNPVTFNLSQ